MVGVIERRWWTYSKQEQKEQIEAAIDWYLSQPGELTDRQKLLLRDAIGHTYRGQFGMAQQDIYELSLPESAWSPTAHIESTMIEGVSRESLLRWLAVLRGAPVQSPPRFM